MSSDDQYFLDILSSIPTDILRYSLEVTTTLERNFDQAALAVRERLSSSTWLPAAARPAPPPLPAPTVRFSHAVYGGGGFLWRSYTSTVEWASENRALTAAVVAFFGTGGWLVYSQRKAYARKRRARRGPRGTRREVVVVMGTLNSQIPRSVVLDLERRGFIVYVVVSSQQEDEMVRAESKVDIIPLHLDVTEPYALQQAISHFNNIIHRSNTVQSDPTESNHFAGLLLIPDLTYPSGPIETISPELWSDALNVKVLNTIATAQAFLRTVRECQSRILVMTPNIVASLQPPFHGVESAIVGAIDGFTASLRGELATLGVSVCHLKLGNFDISRAPGSQNHLQRRGEGMVLDWPGTARDAYARNYLSQGLDGNGWGGFSRRGTEAVKGSPLRELNNAVFDALTQARPRAIWRVGRGSTVYEIVGRWVPAGIVGWMMGLRRADVKSTRTDPLPEDEVYDVKESVQWEKVERMV